MKKNKMYAIAIMVVGFSSLSALSGAEAAAKIVEEQKLPNQLRDGAFTLIPKKGLPVGWFFWKNKGSQGKVRFEKTAGVGQSPAAVLSGGSGTLFAEVKIKGGEQIYARVKTKKSGGGDAVLSFRFQAANKRWLPLTVSKTISFSQTSDWTEVELTGKAPANGETAVLMFGIKNLESPESRIFLDNVELYILPEK